ncbi:hypothetical protein RP20_CCG024335 [Aedes albopictus]|nr:hypothetical protein RP20_CCG024335 [Aedes albopictus]
MADTTEAEGVKKKRAFRKFTYRGVDLDQFLDMKQDLLMELMHSRAKCRLNRGTRRKPVALIKLRKAKKNAPPAIVKAHLRNMIIVEVKPEMIGHYLREFSLTYKPVKHGRPGIGATHSSRFIPLKKGGLVC